jgi:N-ethylmaleimide reductase
MKDRSTSLAPDDAPLFTPYALGGLQLRNRLVMASMTRGRARNAELAPIGLVNT